MPRSSPALVLVVRCDTKLYMLLLYPPMHKRYKVLLYDTGPNTLLKFYTLLVSKHTFTRVPTNALAMEAQRC